MIAKTTGFKWKAVALFYVIALLIRTVVLRNLSLGGSTFSDWLWVWAQGIGPCVGAIAAVLVFRRRFYCTLMGRSIMKSVVTIIFPVIICFLLDRSLSLILLGTVFYSLLEEVGWRGYLQGELKDMNNGLRIFVIAAMWFFWHINVRFDMAGLAFFGVLLIGAWGIGNIARDTRSLTACACFHALFNFSNHGYFEFTPAIIALYVGVFVFWLAIWYVPWKRTVLRMKQLIYNNDHNHHGRLTDHTKPN